MNKYLFFIENNCTFLKGKKISKLIDKINNSIKSIKQEHSNADYLADIERYFNETLDIIRQRKNLSDKGIYKEIVA